MRIIYSNSPHSTFSRWFMPLIEHKSMRKRYKIFPRSNVCNRLKHVLEILLWCNLKTDPDVKPQNQILPFVMLEAGDYYVHSQVCLCVPDLTLILMANIQSRINAIYTLKNGCWMRLVTVRNSLQSINWGVHFTLNSGVQQITIFMKCEICVNKYDTR